jgi:hypothetical protein
MSGGGLFSRKRKSPLSSSEPLIRLKEQAVNILPRPEKNANLLFSPAGEEVSEQLFRHKMNYEKQLEDEDPTGVRGSFASRTSSIASDPGSLRPSNASNLQFDEEEEEEDDEVNLKLPPPPSRNNSRPQNTLTRTGVLVAQPPPPVAGPMPGIFSGGKRKTRKHRKTRKQRSRKYRQSRKYRKH